MAIGEPIVVWDDVAVSGTDPIVSSWVQVGGFDGYSFQASLGASDTAKGVIKIQVANDQALTANDLAGSAQGTTDTGTDKFDKDTAYLQGENPRISFWTRLHFTPASGTGTVNAVISKWGP